MADRSRTPRPGETLFPPRPLLLSNVAAWRFPNNRSEQVRFVKRFQRSPIVAAFNGARPTRTGLALTVEEVGRLIVLEWRRCIAERAAYLKEVAAEIVQDDPFRRYRVAQLVKACAANALDDVRAGRWKHAEAQLWRAEDAARHSNQLTRRPQLERSAKFRGGRRRGAVDELGRVLLEILDGDPEKAGKDVLAALRDRAKAQTPPIVRVTDSKVGRIVEWRDRSGQKRKTSWRTIQDSRLPRVRPIARSR